MEQCRAEDYFREVQKIKIMATKRGRRPVYTPERVAKICEAIENGETNATAAKIGGISISTFCEWQATKAEFSEAVKRAKAAFEEWQMVGILEDAKKSLKTLICGQEYDEVKTEYERNPLDPDTPRIKKQTRITKRILPSPTAVIFALCNRDPEHWQNRVSQDVNGKLDVEQKGPGVSLANVPDSLLAQVIDAINGK